MSLRATCPVGWPLLHHSFTEKILHVPTGQSNRGNPSTEFPSALMTLACVKVAKKSAGALFLLLLISHLLLHYDCYYYFISTVIALLLSLSLLLLLWILCLRSPRGILMDTKLLLHPGTHLQIQGAWVQSVGFTE